MTVNKPAFWAALLEVAAGMKAPGSTMRFVITPAKGAVIFVKPSKVSVRSRFALAMSDLLRASSAACGTTRSAAFFCDSGEAHRNGGRGLGRRRNGRVITAGKNVDSCKSQRQREERRELICGWLLDAATTQHARMLGNLRYVLLRLCRAVSLR